MDVVCINARLDGFRLLPQICKGSRIGYIHLWSVTHRSNQLYAAASSPTSDCSPANASGLSLSMPQGWFCSQAGRTLICRYTQRRSMKPLLYSGINAKKIRAALFSNLWGTFQQWLTGGEPDGVWWSRTSPPTHSSRRLHYLQITFHRFLGMYKIGKEQTRIC